MTAGLKTAAALATSVAMAGLVVCLTPGPGGGGSGAKTAAASAANNLETSPVASQAAAVSPLADALGQGDPGRRAALLEAWAQSVDVKDAPAILEQLGAMADVSPALKQEARGALLTSWCGRDLQSAVTWFCRRGGADPLQQQAREIVAVSIAKSEPAARLAWMQQVLPASGRSELLEPFFREWARIDPAGAAEQLRQLNAPNSSTANNTAWRDILGEVAAQWAAADLDSAVGWVQALPNGPAKSAALMRIAPRWTDVSPRAAAAYAAGLGDSALLGSVAAQWAARDPSSAADWASGLPAGPGREGALESAARIWAEDDPVAAARYLAQLPAKDGQGQAAVAVVAMWATTDPAQAAQWVGKFPEGTVRQQGLAALMSAWVGTDSSSALAYLRELPESASRDSAVDAFGGAIYTLRPNEAFLWEQSISQEPLREQALIRTARYWLQEDPSQAKREIEESNLPPSVKSELVSGSGS